MTFSLHVYLTKLTSANSAKVNLCKEGCGEMIRFRAENNIENIEEFKKFNRLGYEYKNELSTENSFVFIKSKSI